MFLLVFRIRYISDQILLYYYIFRLLILWNFLKIIFYILLISIDFGYNCYLLLNLNHATATKITCILRQCMHIKIPNYSLTFHIWMENSVGKSFEATSKLVWLAAGLSAMEMEPWSTRWHLPSQVYGLPSPIPILSSFPWPRSAINTGKSKYLLSHPSMQLGVACNTAHMGKKKNKPTSIRIFPRSVLAVIPMDAGRNGCRHAVSPFLS